MATSKTTDEQIVMDLLRRQLAILIDELPDVSKKTMKLSTYEPIEKMGKALIADFKVLADILVKETQICDQCGNEIHFEKYAVYPNARVDLPENFGKSYILEQVWQFKPEDMEEE